MSYSQGSSKQRTKMGSIGTAVTGAAFINDWSDRNGKVPMSFEVHCPNNPLDTLTLSLAPRDTQSNPSNTLLAFGAASI